MILPTEVDTFVLALDDLAQECWTVAASKGFHEPRTREQGSAERDSTALECMMLIVTEVAEMAEAFRQSGLPGDHYLEADGKPEGVGVELADVIIRCLDYAAEYHIPIGELVMLKLAYNRTRPDHHGNKII